jgi:hypothetical protein
MKALEKMEELQRTAVIHTDSRITLDSLKNSKNHNYLIEGMTENQNITKQKLIYRLPMGESSCRNTW